MVTVGMNYEVVDGKEEVFEHHFATVVAAMQGAEGHSRTFLYKRVDQPRSYLVVSEWHAQAGFDAFIASDAFKRVTTWGKSGILASRPHHEVYGASAAVSAAPAGCPAHGAAGRPA